MKKFLLLIVAAMATFTAKAETKTYTDQLTVTVNESATTQQTTVEVETLEDNYINFVLRNFVLAAGEGADDEMYVGNIEINNLFLADKGSYKTFSYNANLQIKDGDREDVETWLGPLLGNVPLVLKGKMADDKLYVSIDIDMMSSLNQIISVKFGTDFELPAVTDTKAFTAMVKSWMTSLDKETYGFKFELDEVENYSATVQTLATGDVNLILKNITLSFEGESLALGNLTLNDVETTNRGDYYDLAWNGTALFEEGEGVGYPFPCTFKGKYNGSQLYYTLTVGESNGWEAIYDFIFGTDFAPATATGEGKTYDDKLIVTVNEESTDPMDAHVLVTPLNNGGINFALKNFTMVLDGNEMHVGNIEIADLKLYEGNGYKYFNYSDNLTIAPGDEEGVDEDDYIGPMLGNIPLRMRGRLTDDKLYVTIDIDMQETLGQTISVQFGTDIANGITSIDNGQLTMDNAIYNLSGRRVQKATKGIYIQNGKKYIR